MDYSPLWISLKVAFIAILFTFVLGILAARLMLRARKIQYICDCIFSLPLVLPPTVVGFFLLIIFGKNSWIGQLLEQLGIPVIFHWSGAVIASVVVSFPIMYRTTLSAMEQVDENYIYAARTLGMSETAIFRKIILPISYPGIIAATILAFARALGEFGATMMIAGNIPGRTRTMSIAIYTAVNAGNRELAYTWVGIVMAISFLSIICMNLWNEVNARRFQKH